MSQKPWVAIYTILKYSYYSNGSILSTDATTQLHLHQTNYFFYVHEQPQGQIQDLGAMWVIVTY